LTTSLPFFRARKQTGREKRQSHSFNGRRIPPSIESEQGVHEGVHHRGYILLCALFSIQKTEKGEDMTITANGDPVQLADGTTLQEYLQQKKYNPAVIVCELNLKIVDRETYGKNELHDGDVLEVVSFVGGG
jgi:sulfur carrier protein